MVENKRFNNFGTIGINVLDPVRPTVERLVWCVLLSKTSQNRNVLLATMNDDLAQRGPTGMS